MAGLEQECMAVLLLNTKNHMIASEIVTTGLLDRSLVHPREVFRPAILRNAATLVLVHNHPSGDPTPSATDIRATRQLVKAGKIIGIKVLDHIIIAAGPDGMKHQSLRESEVVSF
jgi:DNA repair protein RadC